MVNIYENFSDLTCPHLKCAFARVDYIALSFAQKAQDIQELLDLMAAPSPATRSAGGTT